MLALASSLAAVLDPTIETQGTVGPTGLPSAVDLVKMLADGDQPQTAALAWVLAHLALDDLSRARVLRSLDCTQLPPWMPQLAHTEVYGAWQTLDTLRDGSNICRPSQFGDPISSPAGGHRSSTNSRPPRRSTNSSPLRRVDPWVDPYMLTLDLYAEEVGGPGELDGLDDRPLPADELDLDDVAVDLHDRLGIIDTIAAEKCRLLGDPEVITAVRRLTHDIAVAEPDVFRRRAKDVNTAAALSWLVARANQLRDRGEDGPTASRW